MARFGAAGTALSLFSKVLVTLFLACGLVQGAAGDEGISARELRTFANVLDFPTASVYTSVYTPSPSAPVVTGTFETPIAVSLLNLSVDSTFVLGVLGEGVNNLCWYPISGNYALLPRVLFYVTIGAAFLLRHHQWLYAGALVATLTYSGVAAVQACLMVWRGPSNGDLDGYALLAVLGTAGVLAVPLLNWSNTLRNIGDKKPFYGTSARRMNSMGKKRDQEFEPAAKIVMIFWAFLVTVGFSCVFVAVVYYEYGFTTGKPLVQWEPVTYGGVPKIRCTPSNGSLSFTHAHIDGSNWLWVTSEFIETNSCSDPCVGPDWRGEVALFRSPTDLAALSFRNLERDVLYISQTDRDRYVDDITTFYLRYGIALWPYVFLQGIYAVVMQLRPPYDARAALYRLLTTGRFPKKIKEQGSWETLLEPRFKAGWIKKGIAKYVALLTYLWAVAVLIISIPLGFGNAIVAEMLLRHLPVSETRDHVGSWGPWVSTLLALIAAFLVKVYQVFWYKRSKLSWPLNGFLQTVIDTWEDIFEEIREFFHFWRDPETAPIFGKGHRLTDEERFLRPFTKFTSFESPTTTAHPGKDHDDDCDGSGQEQLEGDGSDIVVSEGQAGPTGQNGHEHQPTSQAPPMSPLRFFSPPPPPQQSSPPPPPPLPLPPLPPLPASSMLKKAKTDMTRHGGLDEDHHQHESLLRHGTAPVASAGGTAHHGRQQTGYRPLLLGRNDSDISLSRK